LKRILLATDFSVASKLALPLGVELAREFGAEIDLVHVLPVLLPGEVTTFNMVAITSQLAGEAETRLTQFRKNELPREIPVTPTLLSGEAALEINRFAQASRTDLILITTHGHTGLKHFWLGSTAERIVRHAPCPVLIQRESVVPVRFPGASLCRFRRILAPTDFSEASTHALDYAAALVGRCQGEVTLLHVMEPSPYPEFGYAHMAVKEAQISHAVQQQLSKLAKTLKAAGVQSHTSSRVGAAFHEITEAAREQSMDLIVIATHGGSGLGTLVFGSTAERVVRHAPCPVLVVREHEHEFLASSRGARPRRSTR
jgi:nucleotide-binding universal stress UspA family protein